MVFLRAKTIRRVVAAVLAPLLAAGLAAVMSLAGPGSNAVASVLPSGFRDTVALSGLTDPTAVQFSPDGRVFVAQKNGVIKVFPSLTDKTPVTFADLSWEVDNYWDRGLLGLALDPGFPARPYVYVLYAYDAPIGGTAPTWNDACPTPPGPTTDGCVISARVSRLTASGNTMTGAEHVLVNGWCQQFPSHSVGTLMFGKDGALYASAGDGASFDNVDYGQYGASYPGDQANPCGDPPSPAGTVLTPPAAEGGALRSQSVRRTDGPATLNGAIIRINPDTGQGMTGNPFASSPDPNARRIVAYGLRNPFRFTQRPGTNEVWIGDVGWGKWEEIDRLTSPTGSASRNFGWPCYEGKVPQGGYQSAGLNLCTSLYSTPGSVAAPYYSYPHSDCVVSYPGCHSGGSSITGLVFYQGGSYPAAYQGALVFADHSRNEIWAMMPGANGLPDPGNVLSFVGVNADGGARHPVDLKIGPGGDVFYVDMEDGTLHRIIYTVGNQPPTARISASPTAGVAPLTVAFDGSASTDPEVRSLRYSWDLNGDGTFGDATSAKPSYTYTSNGTRTASLRVTDDQGAAGTTSVKITVGNSPPVPVISTPGATLTWRVGQKINFSGQATDAQDGKLPASALRWAVIMHHCITQTNCHTHQIQSFSGVASGSFAAPDHEYPCWLEIRLTAIDSGGLRSVSSLRLDPKTVVLTFKTNHPRVKLKLAVNSVARAAPFSATVVVGSNVSVIAPTPQTLNGTTYRFSSWSDGRARSHVIVAPATNMTYTANYRSG
ncbi:MAG: PQQ-dependent sugar dehydrogenase [Nocardiopsaceae bacterium]|nr:PQQ-dependent sugar dehydrogenase [Nocardiopsaceae bacterium]